MFPEILKFLSEKPKALSGCALVWGTGFNMTTLKKQSIAHALRENFKAYPEDYPINDGGPSDDAIDSIRRWIVNEFKNDPDPDKGSIEEWLSIGIDTYLSFFEDDFDPENEMGENRKYVIDQINFARR